MSLGCIRFQPNFFFYTLLDGMTILECLHIRTSKEEEREKRGGMGGMGS